MKLKQFFFGVILLLAGAGTIAAQQMNMGDELPLDSAVRIGKLANGMTYLIRHNVKPAKMANFYIVYDVGSIQEEDSQSGLAHFLEHMAFNGTEHFPGNSMTHWLEDIGLQFGTNLNAATGMEMTYYQLAQVPLQRETIIDSLLLILHDWSGSLSLDRKEIDKERGVILEERRQRNTAQFRLGVKAAPFVYGDTRYAHRDMLGSEDFLRSFDPQLLRDFHKQWYRPDLQAIVIVGDFDVDQMEAKLKKMMADISVRKNATIKEKIQIPDNEKPVVAVLTDLEENVAKANFFIRRSAVPKELNNRVGANYMNTLINLAAAMTNARFGELMQQAGCPFTRAQFLNSPLTVTCDAMELEVIPRGNEIANAFTSAYGELERIRRYGFTQEEFDFARIQILRAGKQLYETRDEYQSDVLAQSCINHYVKNAPLLSAKMQWMFTQLVLRKATVNEINELMKQLITLRNNVLVITAPEKLKESLPKIEQLESFFSWVRNIDMEPYKVEAVDKPLFSEQVKAGKVMKEEKGIYGSTLWTLNNGIRVVVMPTTYSRNQIVMSGQAAGGLSTVSNKDYFTSSMVAQVASMSGLGELDSEELSKVLTGKSVSVRPAIGRFSSEISGSSAKTEVETMLQLTYLYFMHPNFDRSRFDMMLEANRIGLANAMQSPEFVMAKAVNKATYGDNPRTQIPTKETLNGIDFETMPQIYHRFFTDGAGDYTFYMLGDIDIDVLKPLVEKYLGGLPSSMQKLSWQDDGVRVLSGTKTERLEVPMQTPKSLVSFTYTGDVDYTQSNTTIMVMLTACLQSRYTETIREEKGGTYGVTVNGSLSRQPVPTYRLNISFQTDPSKADELIEIVKEEIARMANEGPKQKDLAKTLEYWKKSQPENLETNQSWLSYLQTFYTWGEDWNVSYEKLMKDATIENLKKFARKIQEDGNLKLVVVEPTK